MAKYRLSTPQGSVLVEAPEGASKAEVIRQYNATVAYDLGREARQGTATTRARLDGQTEIARNTARSREAGVLDYFGEAPKGVVGGAANLLEQGALGLATLLPESAELVVRDGIQSVGGAVQDYVSPDINLGDSVPRKFSEAVGSFAGIVGTSLVNPYLGAGLAVTAGVGEASERARAGGATQEERNLAALQGIIPGALELVPAGRLIKGIKQVFKGDANPVELITNRILRATREGGFEAGQEVASSIAQNMIEQGYNPEQGTLEGSGEAAGYGFGVGALAQSLLDLATPRTRGGTTSDADTETLALPSPEAGIAGLLPAPPKQIADQRTSLGNAQARADIGRMIDSTGDVTLGEMEDIVARTGITLPELETVVSEEMEKRGGALAQRAQTEIEDELTTPTVERDPAIVSQAVANKLDPQGEARKREEQAALERDDVAAFEQPDLLAAELEAERKVSPEAAARDMERRNAQEVQEPIIEESQPRAFDEAQPDLLDVIAQQDNATVRRARAKAQETDLAARTAAPMVKAAQEAPFRQGAERRKAVVDQVLADTTTGSVVNTEKAVQKALAAAGMPRTALTRNEKLAVKNKVAEFKQANRPTAFAPGTANEEQFVVPAAELREAPKGTTPLRAAALTPEAIGEPLTTPERKANANVEGLDPTASRTGPAGDRPSGADRGDGTVRRAGEPTAPDDSGVGSALPSNGVIGDGTKPSSDTLTRFDKKAVAQAAKQNEASREILVDMPIDDFLTAAKQEVSASKLANTRKLAAEGVPFETVPSLQIANEGDGTAKVTGHDGRHRAMALKEQGETTIPGR